MLVTLFVIGVEPLKKFVCIRIDAPRSRQPLVKGERLIRIELSAAIRDIGNHISLRSYPLIDMY